MNEKLQAKKFTATVYDEMGNELAYVRTPETAAAIIVGSGREGYKVKWRTYELYVATREQLQAAPSIDEIEQIIHELWQNAQLVVAEKKQKGNKNV